VNVHNVMLKK